jgi:hypothetical protein
MVCFTICDGKRDEESSNIAFDVKAFRQPFGEQTEPARQQVSYFEQQTAFLYWQQAHSSELVLQHV